MKPGRAFTLSPKKLRGERAREAKGPGDLDLEKAMRQVAAARPRYRFQCVDGPRPCPFASCKFNLYLDVTKTGGIKLNFPDKEIWELTETCALDVADKGGLALEGVGKAINLTRERIRQVETHIFLKLRQKIDPTDFEDPS